MVGVMTDHPPGTIGVCAAELARFSVFTMSLVGVLKPPETQIRVAMGTNIAGNANWLAEHTDGDWLWLLGDDHVFDTGLLLRLLDRDVDVVAPICLMRQAPFKPVVFAGEHEDGRHYFHDGDEWDATPPEGILKVHAVGGAGMLIRKHVLDAIGPPWFDFTMTSEGHRIGEDLSFCRRIRQAGFDIHVDLENPIGHLTTTAVWPSHGPDGWNVRVDFNTAELVEAR